MSAHAKDDIGLAYRAIKAERDELLGALALPRPCREQGLLVRPGGRLR